MATLVLSAVGAAAGASIGGGVLGLSSVAIGKAIGATVGQAVDRRLFASSSGSSTVETGRIERFRLNGASEGAPVEEVFGRMRVGGQVIWASRFLETVNESQVQSGGSGKGGGGSASTTVREYTYSVSVAIAVGRGEISRLGRIWADGDEITARDLNIRVYRGTEDQVPDAKIEAVEGAGNAPAFRGTAYVVIEDLELAPYGNRVPQFSFEVVRAVSGTRPEEDLADMISAVALVPGTGEYSLATTPVHETTAPGVNRSLNVNSVEGVTDFQASVDVLRAELPNHGATSLVVSWVGDDLRCGSCSIQPKVEQRDRDGVGMPWRVAGVSRAEATVMPEFEGGPVYGGTPADAAVIEAIGELRAGGREVMFYPFVLMDQLAGNGLADPYSEAVDQPELPWRGRITCSVAPGVEGSPDGTAAVDAEVATFFGSAAVSDFSVVGGAVSYSGPAEWSFRRFILHYAHLCVAAGGVDSFCIGSELRGLTTLRGASGFPVVEALRVLAGDVRAVLGPHVKVGYAADWTEYFGYRPDDGSGDVYFHLDPLWADPAIDFIGIDNYVPLADWRDGEDHADVGHGSVYDLSYLQGNIEGGEGFDWYYPSDAARDAQDREKISDGAHGEAWVYRYKDLRGWWENAHHERVGGVRSAVPTAWVPGSKPFWFTEVGCPSVDKGANEPNKFFDPKSSESDLPHYSTGARDDFMQMQYLRAQLAYWRETANNPVSAVYGGPMVDVDRAFVWAWDARPYPAFPVRGDLWSDGGNYALGHWLNGRTSSRALASVVAEICDRAGLVNYDVSRLYGLVRGYVMRDGGTARAALQPLMLAHGFDAVERDGVLVFRTRDARVSAVVDAERVVVTPEIEGDLERVRQPFAETVGRVRVNSFEADRDYAVRASEAIFPDEATRSVAQTDVPLVLTETEARAVADRWLTEARIGRDTVRFALPASCADVGAGDVVEIAEPGGAARYRVNRVEVGSGRSMEAVRVAPEAVAAGEMTRVARTGSGPAYVAALPVFPVFLDLPLLRGDEVAHAPHVAVHADPWPGSVAVYSSASENGFVLDGLVTAPAVIGETLSVLAPAASGLWDRGAALRVRVYGGTLMSAEPEAVFGGANVAAIGTGADDIWEVFQFAEAALVSPGVYDLRMRLRGQAGTDAVAVQWPVGSRFVLLSQAFMQVDHGLAARGLARTYRVGPAAKAVDDPVYVTETRAFEGVGLRPLASVHLRAVPDGAGGEVFTWVRRTRVDGDSWQGLDVPLGEGVEQYLVRVEAGGALVREAFVNAPSWTYRAADQASDGVTGPYEVAVAQVSESFGAGPFRRISRNG
ncbi:MAG: glycoside hydrolase/phage tail family protein [Pseudomonadota bacterium]